MDNFVGKGIFFSAVDVDCVGSTVAESNIHQCSDTQYNNGYDRERDQRMTAILGWTAEKKKFSKLGDFVKKMMVQQAVGIISSMVYIGP